MRRRPDLAAIVVPRVMNLQGATMRVTIDDIGVREYPADHFDVDGDGFVILSKSGNFVAAIPTHRVVMIEMPE